MWKVGWAAGARAVWAGVQWPWGSRWGSRRHSGCWSHGPWRPGAGARKRGSPGTQPSARQPSLRDSPCEQQMVVTADSRAGGGDAPAAARRVAQPRARGGGGGAAAHATAAVWQQGVSVAPLSQLATLGRQGAHS
jgi:hypothetical protein